jgi:hypothetical protein
MERPTRRRFGLLDVMILVAGIAAGLGLGHNYRVQVQRVPGGFHAGLPEWLVAMGYVLQGLTVAALAIQCRPPCPPVRRLARRGGFSACVAALMATGFAVAWGIGQGVRQGWPSLAPIAMMITAHPLPIAPAVAGVWVVQKLSGRPWSRSEWPDRLGRACGAGWLIAAVVALVAQFF